MYRNGYRVVELDNKPTEKWAVVYGGRRITKQKAWTAELGSGYGEVLVQSFETRAEAQRLADVLARAERQGTLGILYPESFHEA